MPIDSVGKEEVLDLRGDLSHQLLSLSHEGERKLTSTGDKKLPQSMTNFPNIPYGPHFSTFLSRPYTDSSSYVIPISTSSDWATLSCPMGMSSAVGMASRKLYISKLFGSALVGAVELTFPVWADRIQSGRRR